MANEVDKPGSRAAARRQSRTGRSGPARLSPPKPKGGGGRIDPKAKPDMGTPRGRSGAYKAGRAARGLGLGGALIAGASELIGATQEYEEGLPKRGAGPRGRPGRRKEDMAETETGGPGRKPTGPRAATGPDKAPAPPRKKAEAKPKAKTTSAPKKAPTPPRKPKDDKPAPKKTETKKNNNLKQKTHTKAQEKKMDRHGLDN